MSFIIRRTNLVKVISYLALALEDEHLNMDSFVDDFDYEEFWASPYGKNPMKTPPETACILGHALHLDKTLDFHSPHYDGEKGEFDYRAWSIEFLFQEGANQKMVDRAWEFMFSREWPNNVNEAVIRLSFCVQKGRAPIWYDAKKAYKGAQFCTLKNLILSDENPDTMNKVST